MGKLYILLIIIPIMGNVSCSKEKTVHENPFFNEWGTSFGIPPFSDIRPEHYIPAFEEGMQRHLAEIGKITVSGKDPDFENTVLAFDNSGQFLQTVHTVFSLIAIADTNDELQKIEEEISPRIAAHYDDIYMNERLFERIKSVYDNRSSAGLDSLQQRLTEKKYEEFVRAGAMLSEQGKEELRNINGELSIARVKFANNLLAANNDFKMEVDSADAAGLPTQIREAARAEAKEAGVADGYVFTLKKPSMIPFLTNSDKRHLREQLYNGYLDRCNEGSPNDNRQLINDIVRLRTVKAKLLGFETFADYQLQERMAKNPAAVYGLLDQIWQPALERAGEELAEMRDIKYNESGDRRFASWDWWYYSEKLRVQKYALDEEMLKPYFSLSNVQNGIFDLCNRLYGITFRPMVNAPVYNKECTVYEVLDRDNSHLGVLIMDFHPRPGKSGGAWCGTYRDRTYSDGEKTDPIVTIVCNFSRPVGSRPALLTIDETETFFHEFGHAVHSLFTDVPYRGLAGVEQDFVELPSQIMENWATEPQMLERYAFHYSSNNPIPNELIDKITASKYFNQGFATLEYLAASYTDMDIHTLTGYGAPIDVNDFEYQALYVKRRMISEIAPRYRYPYFSHIFDVGCSAGYYGYIWSEVLDKDAYEAFEETGDIFNRQVADSFRKNILNKGGSADGMTLYHNFRGKSPSSDYLMYARGLKERPPRPAMVEDIPQRKLKAELEAEAAVQAATDSMKNAAEGIGNVE